MRLKNLLIEQVVSLCRKKNKRRGDEHRFLILSTTGLGDTLWATPAIKGLRDSFPHSPIYVLTSPLGKEVLLHNPHITELIVVDHSPFFSLFSLYRRLKKKEITDVILFHTSQRPILPLAAMLSPSTIIGTRGINKGLDSLLTLPVEPSFVHEIERRLQLIQQVGATVNTPLLEFHYSREDEEQADQFLHSLNLPANTLLIAMHPGAKDQFKQWPPSHFAALGRQLKHTLPCCILLTGSPSEKPLIEMISSQIEGSRAVYHLPLRATAALLRKVDLMIANDTGPMHIAFAVKTPTVALFGPTHPLLCGPHAATECHVIATQPTCSPCLRKKCHEPFCLLQIGVTQVYDACISLLKVKREQRI
jgi:ADP-heptose:LPS heptosyltransferase